jgi:3-oxoacyl-[acyl-carrier-protein] synthase II
MTMRTTTPAITGIGAVTAYGWGREQLWTGLLSGESAVREHDGYGDALGHRAWVARIEDGGEEKDGPSRFSRAMRFAAREAVEDAYQHGWIPGRTVGLVHAVVLGEVDLWRDFYLQHNGERPVRDYLALMPSTPMSTLMQEFGFHGPAMNVSAMCASGNAAILTANAWLEAGICTDVVIVASDLSCTPENVRHFRDLGVAITDVPPAQACRPFQEGSRGFQMGEASIGYVLSKNTTTPYARLLGGMMSHDAHHVTSIAPELDQVRRCFDAALDNAGVKPEDVAYLNAHGPGTRQCDRAESTMLEELLLDAEVYSMKPLAGHCQAAASAVEIAATALAYERDVIPAPRTVAPGHERLLDGPTVRRTGPTVKSSLGMGGHNSVIVLDDAH